ncbi:hypothetical protein OHC33_006763 [Knufia fluminis]|uniref:Uncharacterized protein n=1 Tax=Knufia fluminis TaxID=191047 RepID=A0AAN8ELQ4_9EURO|nr:hypothetical protein OHC33_006763 [Knufia fluminis]
MGRGRPPKPGTAEEKAAARRERVKNNVRALRERRRKEADLATDQTRTSQLAVEQVDEKIADTPSPVSKSVISSGASKARKTSDTSTSYSSASTKRSVGLFLVSRCNDARLILPTTVDTKSPYATALLAAVREQFLPDPVYLPPAINNTNGKPWESTQFLWTPCAFWVTSAFTKASNQEPSLLRATLLSVGMLMKSLQFQDTFLKIASLEMYRRCLQGIRKSLEPLVDGRSERPKDSVALYLSCHVAAMFELIQNPDLNAAMQHLRGVSQLICHLGDGRDEDGQSIAWLLLQDYRFSEMGLCLKYRYASVISLRRRQFERSALGNLKLSARNISAHGYGSHNMLVRITDLADEISAVMVQLDILRPHLKRADALMKLREMLDRLGKVWADYEYLHDQLTSRYGSAFVYKDTSGENPGFGSLKFKTIDIGAAWCHNLMTQIHCIETQIDATSLALAISNAPKFDESLLGHEHSPEHDRSSAEPVDEVVSYKYLQGLRYLHRSICIQLTQCLHYFLQTDKGVTGQALAIFPLDTATSMLESELQRLQIDLQDARILKKSPMLISSIQQEITKLGEARAFCRQMQDRAEALGMPGFGSSDSEPRVVLFSSGTEEELVPKSWT